MPRVYRCVDGIWRCLPPDRAAVFAPFLRDYTAIRDAEGYGYDDLARLQRLPEVDPAEPLAGSGACARSASPACGGA